MSSRQHLYDLLESHWPAIADGLAAVWSEGAGVGEVARRLGADPDSATEVTLADLSVGFDGENIPGDYDGILLVGEFAERGAWTLTLQIQWSDVVEPWALESLSRDGGRAVGVSWRGGTGYRIYYAQDGEVMANSSMTMIPAILAAYGEGLEPEPDWEIPGTQGCPIAQMVTTSLVIIGRVTGEEISAEWLRTPHTRYLIPGNA
ncbi:hypothetical protein [Nonomuraea aridisoli]|uniref:Uncharacterized protein n=1 Tax=Nonomuraea aridisoli TaxID=2070368 RepID=A0A2W2EI86_9ACTN|nr:hypothetical protein [Nonomuraea aridisoli]PZG16619.1 hypothetical protein C1J01_20330 [Nonomuraea aridisoli]